MTAKTKNIIRQTLALSPTLREESYLYAKANLPVADGMLADDGLFVDRIDRHVVEAMRTYIYMWERGCVEKFNLNNV